MGPRVPATEARADAALVLWGHGIHGGPGVLEAHARRLAGLKRFSDVRAACWRGIPGLADVVAGLTAARIYLVPMLMADGYLARSALNAAIDALGPDVARLRLAPVLGRNPRLAEVLLEQVLSAARKRDWVPADTTLLLVGHGTPRDRNSRGTAFAHAAEIERRGVFARVATAFLEDQPSLAQAAGCDDGSLVAVGLFADAGPHGEDDVRRVLAALGRRHAYAGVVGRARRIPELVLEQVMLADRLSEAA